jgi:phytoene synthase
VARDPVVAHSARVISAGARSFHRAALLLPRRARHGVYHVYAWCRYCDDLVDRQVLGHGQRRAHDRGAARALLESLRSQSARAVAGAPGLEPPFAALARAVRDHDVPPDGPPAFLDGLALDIEDTRYQTIDDLLVYCDRVAGTLGVMMAHAAGLTSPRALEAARTLGTALQLTNIARDVMDDAAAGRVYLPLAWLADAGVSPERIAEPAERARVAEVVVRLLDCADEHYRRADRTLAALPFRAAWAAAAARGMYAEIGTLVRTRGPRAWDTRAVVPGWRKLYWVMRGLRAAVTGRSAV